MGLVSPKGAWLQVNSSLCDMLGYSEEELLQKPFQEFVHPDDLGLALANVKQLLDQKTQTCLMEKRYFRKGGDVIWVLWNVARLSDDDSKSAPLVFQVQDITDRKRSEERLLHDAFHDPLTGLPNRALLVDHLKLAIARTQRSSDDTFAILFLDVDRFKVVNDSLGHASGDELLVGIARRLESCMRLGDTVARVGGDEFTILLEDLKNESEAILAAERIQKELAAAFSINGREVFITVSIGIALGSRDYQLSDDVLPCIGPSRVARRGMRFSTRPCIPLRSTSFS
jgi:diguanylate cyclase (GGDEF)-like protein/PAS domain S-box-containing protein